MSTCRMVRSVGDDMMFSDVHQTGIVGAVDR